MPTGSSYECRSSKSPTSRFAELPARYACSRDGHDTHARPAASAHVSRPRTLHPLAPCRCSNAPLAFTSAHESRASISGLQPRTKTARRDPRASGSGRGSRADHGRGAGARRRRRCLGDGAAGSSAPPAPPSRSRRMSFSYSAAKRFTSAALCATAIRWNRCWRFIASSREPFQACSAAPLRPASS